MKPFSWHEMGENLLRELTPQVLAAIIRRYNDFDAAEDAVQDALLAAAVQWPKEGVPRYPRAWLIKVASRRMADFIRTDVARRQREHQSAIHNIADETVDPVDAKLMGLQISTIADDTLALFFMCCHPRLTTSSAVALTLRAIGGLTTAEIAAAYMVPERTMGQRISRAKRLLREESVPFQIPGPSALHERLKAVLHTLYLIFNRRLRQ